MNARQFHLVTIVTAAFLSALAVMLFSAGCENGEPEPFVEPEANREVALREIALVYTDQFVQQIRPVRDGLFITALQIAASGLDPDEAHDYLMYFNDVGNGSTFFTGMLDLSGTVILAYPDSYDSTLTGLDMDSLEWVHRGIEEGIFTASKVELNDSLGAVLGYFGPILTEEEILGLLWAEVSVDSLTRRGLAYDSPYSSAEEAVFILDDRGVVIYDDNIEFGADFSDSSRFGADNSELAVQMLLEDEGHTSYDSDNAPGAGETGGARLLGWAHFTIQDTDRFWVIGVTEPVDSSAETL